MFSVCSQSIVTARKSSGKRADEVVLLTFSEACPGNGGPAPTQVYVRAVMDVGSLSCSIISTTFDNGVS